MSERWLFLSSRLINTAQVSLAAVMITSISAAALARPSGLGVFSAPDAAGKGTYTTASGSKGTYVITGGNLSGYAGTEFKVGDNGLQVLNKVLQSDTTKDKDKFEYKITLTPDNATEVHNILIAQSGYEATGNSEIAKQTLTYEPAITTLESKAVVAANPSVNFFMTPWEIILWAKKYPVPVPALEMLFQSRNFGLIAQRAIRFIILILKISKALLKPRRTLIFLRFQEVH